MDLGSDLLVAIEERKNWIGAITWPYGVLNDWLKLLMSQRDFYYELDKYIHDLKIDTGLRVTIENFDNELLVLRIRLQSIYETLVRHFCYRNNAIMFELIKPLDRHTVMFTDYSNEEVRLWQL